MRAQLTDLRFATAGVFLLSMRPLMRTAALLWDRLRGMRWGVATAVCVGLLAAFLAPLVGTSSAAAQADSTHYQTLQLGERSRGMAGAFTAYAADGAAIWFNPAGLPLLEPKLLQGSLSLIQRRTLKYSGALVSDGPDGPGGEDQVEDFNLKSNPTLPGFAVASFALGKRKEELDNRKPLQIAISAFVLYNVELGGDVNFQDQFLRTNSLQFYQDDRASYFAAAIGHRPTRNFSWGITLLARNRVIEHVETASLAFGGTQDPSRGSPCPTSPTIPFCVFDATQVSRNTVFRMNSWDLSLRIGLLNLIGERWRVGLMFQPPGFKVGGKSNLRFELSDVVSSNASLDPGLSDSVFANVQSGARSPIPWELRVGVSYVISSKVVVAADVQFVGRVPDGSIAPGIPQLEGRANTSGALLADSTKRDFTWNISLGSEIQINRFLFTRFGFLTDNSSAPDASGAADFVRPVKTDRYGFSASVGGAKNGKGLSAGVSVLFGKGTANGLDFRNEAFENDRNFLRVPVKERILIISVGGDIGQTADVVTTSIKEKKSRKEIEAEEEAERAVRLAEMEAETDPDIKAAKERAIKAREERDEAERRAKEADAEVERLKATKPGNLDAEGQEALQGGTQSAIETIR
ncbi:MAG: hypothetical protein KJO40_08215 [Deltaproteobacteria bacterium]|nr:hypothetical protein [Deltaproteobacteria bacterium]NNK09054.1 hypothetical protein [Myxococcales bacterium]NNK44477.1 hypothetical protein [Myxococcales bacterium]